jgi:hypothetical protein
VIPFRTVSVVRHPRERVFRLVRDELASLVALLDDVKEVRVLSREDQRDGCTLLVNLWVASPPIPDAVRAVLGTDTVSWTDTALWRAASFDCSWRIELQLDREGARCAGTTRYEEAMGGRGTRITFEGELDVTLGKRAALPESLSRQLSRTIESFAGDLVPLNFRRLAGAVDHYLGRVAS